MEAGCEENAGHGRTSLLFLDAKLLPVLRVQLPDVLAYSSAFAVLELLPLRFDVREGDGCSLREGGGLSFGCGGDGGIKPASNGDTVHQR